MEFARTALAHGNMQVGKRKNARAGDGEPLVPDSYPHHPRYKHQLPKVTLTSGIRDESRHNGSLDMQGNAEQ